jgi:hypothetical protein
MDAGSVISPLAKIANPARSFFASRQIFVIFSREDIASAPQLRYVICSPKKGADGEKTARCSQALANLAASQPLQPFLSPFSTN